MQIDFVKLGQLYDAIKAVDAESDAFRKAIRALSVENEFFGSDKVYSLQKTAYQIALDGDERLISDFEYLLWECPSMKDGGSITIGIRFVLLRICAIFGNARCLRMTNKLTLGSLFDGISGFPLAGSECGIETKWACEIEPYPRLVSHARFSNVKQYGDIRKLNGAVARQFNL
jgi:hypothetical protein